MKINPPRKDKFGNNYLSPGFYLLTDTEKMDHLIQVGFSIIEHKCHYYVFDGPQISDAEYDYIERYYEAVCEEMGEEPKWVNMVGFDESKPECKEVLDALLARGHERKKEEPSAS